MCDKKKNIVVNQVIQTHLRKCMVHIKTQKDHYIIKFMD